MNPDRVMRIIANLAAMKFFPSDVDARIAIAEQFAAFAETEEQVQWTVKRAMALCLEWPGVHELRAIYCSRWKPADGIEAHSTIYDDGIPADPEISAQVQAAITGRQTLQITGELGRCFASDFPCDSLGLIAQAVMEASAKHPPRAEKLRCHAEPASEAEIEHVKAEQDRNRKESAA